jgi:hypothetical protein
MILRGSDSSDLAAESFHRDLTEQKLISMNDKKNGVQKIIIISL